MPRYFFHYRDGVERIDREGIELAGVTEARTMAAQSAGEAMIDLGAKFWDHPVWNAWVTDENGNTVCSLRLSPNATG
jgi:hypothetical protein